MSTEQNILTLATRYAEHRGLKLSTVATYAANDGKTFERLAAGGSCTLRTADKLLGWFAARWPDGLAWPADIPRPKPKAPRASARDAA